MSEQKIFTDNEVGIYSEIGRVQEKWLHRILEETGIVPTMKNGYITIEYPNFGYWEMMREFLLIIHRVVPNKSYFNEMCALMEQEHAQKWFFELNRGNTFFIQQQAEKYNVKENYLLFLAEMAYRPYLRAAVHHFSEEERLQLKVKHQDCCTVCHEPYRVILAHSQEIKELFCIRCFNTKSFDELHCIHCGNDSDDTLQYIQVDGDSFARILACEECKGYVKVIQTDSIATHAILGELDIMTTYLDAVAKHSQLQAIEERESITH